MGFNLYKDIIREALKSQLPAVPDQSDFRQFFLATDTLALYVWSPKNASWTLVNATADVNTGVTAGTTQTIAGATQLTGSYNNVTVVANSGDAVGLPALKYIGQQVLVVNVGANPAKVFPAVGDTTKTIDGGTAGASVTLTNVKSALFTATTLINWQSIGFATRSA